LNLADLLLEKDLVIHLAVHDLLPDLRHAARTQRVGSAGPTKRGFRLLIRLQQRFVRPLRGERRFLVDLICRLEKLPGATSDVSDCFFSILDRLMHLRELSSWNLGGPAQEALSTARTFVV